MPIEPRSFDVIASELLNEPGIPQLAGEGIVTPAVSEAYKEYAASVSGLIKAGDNYKAVKHEVNTRPMIAPSEREALQREARKTAEEQRSRLVDEGQRALKKLEAALTETATPKLDLKREQAARQELELAISGARPEAAAVGLATNGSREALGALFTSYGKTLLTARGVEDPDRVLKDARAAAVAVAGERGGTPREIVAGKLLKKKGRFVQALPTAASHIDEILAKEDSQQERIAAQRAREDERAGR
jgi:hypothetical protein